MKKISLFIISILIISTNITCISSAKNVNSNEIDRTVVGEVNVSLRTQSGNDEIYFYNWYKIRETTLHFGFEKLQVNLPWSYYAEDLNSTNNYDLYINFQANNEKNHTWIEVLNEKIEKGEITIEIPRKLITYIKYNVTVEIYKDDIFLDSDNFGGRIIIMSIRSQPGSNYPIIMLITRIIKNLFFN
jgi:hypothetical protein